MASKPTYEVQPDGIVVKEHFVPWTAALSEDALAVLKVYYAAPPTDPPDPSDHEGWRAFKLEQNAMGLAYGGVFAVAERPGVSCETRTIGGVTTYVCEPKTLRPGRAGKVYLEMHGGGLIMFEGEGCRREALFEAERMGVRTIGIDYRTPPDHPYPAALDDCLAVYRALLEEFAPGDIIVGGLSGGGNLAGALPLRIRDEGLPLPAGAILLSPELDLTETGESFTSFIGHDAVLKQSLMPYNLVYAQGADLSHPYLSPIFDDFSKGYPPTFLQTGTRDSFMSNAVRMHRALRRAGIYAELHIWEGMPHGNFLGKTPEDLEIDVEMRAFMDRIWAS